MHNPCMLTATGRAQLSCRRSGSPAVAPRAESRHTDLLKSKTADGAVVLGTVYGPKYSYKQRHFWAVLLDA
jgi:hypothetical protein